ncbi:MAG: 50S ribosomal protein L3 [Spirochaetales bacterium]|nr:50S ribosomal protein L3 [Spirochaetales bacterium]
MAKGLLGTKLGMSHVFDAQGRFIPVTIIQAGPCSVSQVKTVEKDRYEAIQLAYGQKPERRSTKATTGHLKKAGIEGAVRLAEFRNSGITAEPGAVITADVFAAGEKVKVTGIAKGKGFQGVIKRHGFGGGRASHGSHFHRAPGSLGAGTFPGRVFKGHRMPGHAGARKQTATHLTVVQVDVENHLLLIQGAIPGPRHGIVRIEAMS